MTDLLDRFAHAVDGMAALSGYPHVDRRQAWIDRLRVNLPELDRFTRLQPEPDLGILAPPPVRSAEGGRSVPDDGGDGIALIASECRAAPERTAEPARVALEKARQRNDLNAFITLADEASLNATVASAVQSLREGAPMPLMGVPIAVKDLMSVAGFPQTNGSGGPKPDPATHDAVALGRLRDAGAIVIGTTNLHEFAYGITSENPHYGWVVNPRCPGHTAGGSSGGSAAAVAAGIVRLALGSDTAGSIRLPASCPALTLQCGRGDNGLPIGVQIAGRRGDDWRVLDVGARLEDLLNPTT